MDAAQLKALESTTSLTFAGKSITDVVVALIPYLFTAAGLLLLVYLVLGGLELMTSAGEPKGVQAGKDKITNAIIGFVIVFVAYWIVQIIAQLLGLTKISDIFK